ncbi:hypothetical protein IWQ61_004689 [Dispira simplex]|nr:hypothetical protein IWQ61_004689 [Dispira simplex]
MVVWAALLTSAVAGNPEVQPQVAAAQWSPAKNVKRHTAPLLAPGPFHPSFTAPSRKKTNAVNSAYANFNNTDLTITGLIVLTLDSCNCSTNIDVSMGGLQPRGKYQLHIHQYPVDVSGDCESTGDHFDPLHVNTNTTEYACDPDRPVETCEVGDLAGKFGTITASKTGTYLAHDWTDQQIGTSPELSVIDRSVVLHDSANNRVACGNIHGLVLR